MNITVPSPTMTAIRDGLKFIGGIVTAFGWASESTWGTISGIVIAAVPSAYAIYKQFKMRDASAASQ